MSDTRDRFPACLAETLRWEGGYSDHPRDPGGPTMAGVIQRVYDAWRDQMGLERRHVREIERRELEAIYRQNYWRAVRGDELPPGVDLVVWDFGVNSGPGRAIRALQACVGVTVDGHLGAGTLAAVRAADPDALVSALMAERRRFLRQIKTFPTFGKGWLRRCDGVEATARLHVAHGCGVTAEPPVLVVPLPLADLDAQSATQGRATPPPTPARVGVAARAWGWLLTALGLGAGVEQAADALPAVDAAQALSLWERVEPLLTRLLTSTAGLVTLAAIAAGVVVVLIGRASTRRQILEG
jgi:lysozyme family protein